MSYCLCSFDFQKVLPLYFFFFLYEYCSSYFAVDFFYCFMYGFSRLHGLFEVFYLRFVFS